MVKVRENLTGKKFGRLTVIEQTDDYITPRGKHSARWLCECNCEEHNRIKVSTFSLKSKHTQSCGCLSKEKIIERNKNNCKQNRYDLSGEYGIGWTSNTDKEFYFDLEDYDKIKNYCWREDILNTGYHALEASKKDGTNLPIRMHWLIADKNYDHIDRNPLNNRKGNLRKATKNQNAQNNSIYKNNTSGVIGVSFNQNKNKWVSSIQVDKRQIYLGSFVNKNDAIIARLNAELLYFKEFAPQKYLYEKYGITQEDKND